MYCREFFTVNYLVNIFFYFLFDALNSKSKRVVFLLLTQPFLQIINIDRLI